MVKIVRFLVATVGLVASIIAIALAPRSFWCALYPLPLIALLVVGLAGSWAYILLSRRGPSPADQQRLNRLFGVLPRQAVRRIADADFHAGWSRNVNWPVSIYVNDMDAPEDRFDSRKMERARARLLETARRFDYVNAKHGFPHAQAHAEGWRNTGWSPGEVEGLPEKQRAMAEKRARAITIAAEEMVEAHDALVKAARRRGFNLDALASQAPEFPGAMR